MKEAEVKVSIFTNDDKVLTRSIPAIKVEPGKKTVVSVSLLSFDVKINDEWGGDIVIEF